MLKPISMIMTNAYLHYLLSGSVPKSPMNMESVKGYNFMELESATSSFSDLSQIGRGGYGKVYKGHLPGGLIVAVKRAEQGSLQGQKEFYTEIELLSRLHHRNLVPLLGYCDQKGEQMLVYEFMPQGSLQDALSGKNKIPCTSWSCIDIRRVAG